MSRDLQWDGGYNVRDLGGLPAADGRRIRQGAVVRSASPAFLTESGWGAGLGARHPHRHRPDRRRQRRAARTIGAPT
ncbi:tyrosine-protein phosphatase [Saccharopolyspora hattusasensis]|uniref:tyrosine-protein phosphatase n=1 Tax=Saccharopolyspora hattusasensis TaxID=1128679 RepID=UPI003D98F0A8